MKLPRASKTFHIDGKCPDCGYGHITAWEANPVDGKENTLARRCLCPDCGCWFQEDLRLEIQTVDMTRTHEDGEEETRRGALSPDTCPWCGKPLDVADSPYFGDDEEVEWEESKDVGNYTHRTLRYCLDCHAEVKETYRMVRAGTRAIRHGLGANGAECCPRCGSMEIDRNVDGKPTFTACRECGCRYEVETEEAYNQTRISTDRDGLFSDADVETLYDERIVKVGDLCPMCGKGVVAASPDYAPSPRLRYRGSRIVSYECLECFTTYEDVYDTRVIGKVCLS